jgi:hypothetical protein
MLARLVGMQLVNVNVRDGRPMMFEFHERETRNTVFKKRQSSYLLFNWVVIISGSIAFAPRRAANESMIQSLKLIQIGQVVSQCVSDDNGVLSIGLGSNLFRVKPITEHDMGDTTCSWIVSLGSSRMAMDGGVFIRY